MRLGGSRIDYELGGEVLGHASYTMDFLFAGGGATGDYRGRVRFEAHGIHVWHDAAFIGQAGGGVERVAHESDLGRQLLQQVRAARLQLVLRSVLKRQRSLHIQPLNAALSITTTNSSISSSIIIARLLLL